MILPGASIVQIAFVVKDLEEAALRYSRLFGAGPFLVKRHVELAELRYRGVLSPTDFSIAVVQAGEIQLELVEQHDDSPSVYRDLFPEGAEGFHHVAVIVPDLAAEIRRYRKQGFEVASSGRFGDSDFAYVDTSGAVGHMVEILPDTETIRTFFAAARSAAEARAGEEPLREMA